MDLENFETLISGDVSLRHSWNQVKRAFSDHGSKIEDAVSVTSHDDTVRIQLHSGELTFRPGNPERCCRLLSEAHNWDLPKP